MSAPGILLVDDEADILELVAAMLEGYRVTCALNVAEAKAAFEREPYALVITDIRMPGSSGLSFIAYVKERAPATPVIVVTGHEGPTGPAAGSVFRWISKPFRRRDIVAAVEAALQSRKDKEAR
jgi:DNA-binding NtrC family response regulator